jgi:membrane protein implicated in regulation of membrane protease activity
MLFAILCLVAAVILLPVAFLSIIGLVAILPKLIAYGVGILALIVVVIFPILMCDPRERAALRQWINESRDKRNAARVAQESGPQS